MKNNMRGFSLIELMIVVAIIGILALISYPSYQSYILQTYREDAKTRLMELMNAQSRYFAKNFAYTDSVTTLLDNDEAGKGNYTIVSVCNNTACKGYAAAAFIKTTSSYRDDDPVCGNTITVSSDGTKSSGLGVGCWNE